MTQHQQYSTALPSLSVGEVALENGEPTVAASIADSRLAKIPGETPALLLRAKAEAAMGENGPAISDFQRILAVQPRSADAALGLARIIMAGDPAGAEALLAPFVIGGTRNASVLNNLGVARDLLGRHEEAQAVYQKALAADPAMHSAQVNLARSLALSRGDAL